MGQDEKGSPVTLEKPTRGGKLQSWHVLGRRSEEGQGLAPAARRGSFQVSQVTSLCPPPHTHSAFESWGAQRPSRAPMYHCAECSLHKGTAER